MLTVRVSEAALAIGLSSHMADVLHDLTEVVVARAEDDFVDISHSKCFAECDERLAS